MGAVVVVERKKHAAVVHHDVEGVVEIVVEIAVEIVGVVTATAMTGAQLAGTIEEVVVTAMRADVPEMMIVKGPPHAELLTSVVMTIAG